ncbi:MAG: DUF2868 domain-containing protein [Xanthomonadaceae bacterium]|nr:DUF2868 domain-containing protein [Xanthomonadaceae bacterium]
MKQTGSSSRGLSARSWLLAETTRRLEESAGDYILDDPATRRAAGLPAGPVERIVERAAQRPEGERLQTEIEHALSATRWIVIVLLLAGLVGGITAAASIPSADGSIALSYAIVALLGLPLLLLLIWAGISLRSGRQVSGGLPGRIGVWLLLLMTRRFGLAAHRRHLSAALADLARHHGRVLAALATHGFWTFFFFGCLLSLWLRFIGLRFDFSWETTLLSGDWLDGLIGWIGWLPTLIFGMPLPSPEQIEAILEGHSPAVDRGLWAGYLLATIAIYGLAPRALLVLAFAWRWRRIQPELDLGRPGYLRLLPALAGSAGRSTGKIGPAPPATRNRDKPERAGTNLRTPTDSTPGAPVLIAVELGRVMDPSSELWSHYRFLGLADDRHQRRALIEALKLLDPPPREIVALCAIERTPDRGTGRFLAELARFAPLQILLDDPTGPELPERAWSARIADWDSLAADFGLSEVRQVSKPAGS